MVASTKGACQHGPQIRDDGAMVLLANDVGVHGPRGTAVQMRRRQGDVESDLDTREPGGPLKAGWRGNWTSRAVPTRTSVSVRASTSVWEPSWPGPKLRSASRDSSPAIRGWLSPWPIPNWSISEIWAWGRWWRCRSACSRTGATAGVVFGRTRLTHLAPVGTPCRTCRPFARVGPIDHGVSDLRALGTSACARRSRGPPCAADFGLRAGGGDRSAQRSGAHDTGASLRLVRAVSRARRDRHRNV